ncbi:MAG: ParB N-terminal domain-containing protein [Paracoccaceae bacterium]
MAKRKRLTFDPDMAENREGAAPEVKAFLRPGGSFGAAPPIAQVAGEASAQAALAELSEAMAQARTEGRMVLRLGLDQIAADHLVRDRLGIDEEELAGLMASIREHGQRTPVEVAELAPGRYGLISGWRRCQALARLAEETGEAPQVLALVRRPETAAEAYVAMVEENEIRLGLSYYERARIAGRAVEMGVFTSEKQALQRLFSNASRARRSKIGSFLTLWRHLDEVLRFPAAIPERLGLNLDKALAGAEAGRIAALVADLRDDPPEGAAEEQARLARFVSGREMPKTAGTEPVSTRHELRPGVFLDISGGFLKPVLTLSGPGVDPGFREALEHWLAEGR